MVCRAVSGESAIASAWAGSIWLRPRVASGSPARSTRTPASLAGSGARVETRRTSSPSTTISPSGSARTNSDRSILGASFPREAAPRPFAADARRKSRFQLRAPSASRRPLSVAARGADRESSSLACPRRENASASKRPPSDARGAGREVARARASSDFRVRRARKCPSPSTRCGHRRRQPFCDAPTPGSEKVSGSKSGCARRNSRTTPSFSCRLNVQVEYTSRPPGRSMRAAAFRIAVWRAAQPTGASGFHCAAVSGSRRNMPSPEQGASTSTQSKNAGSARASASAAAEVTKAFETPSRSRFPSRTRARENSISLESRKPRPFSRAAICPLLPPGAAHRSSTRSPGRGSSAATGAIADASCK